jgi:hypothetical protein
VRLAAILLVLLPACQSNGADSLVFQASRLVLPAGGRVVEPPGPARVGRRVETSACYAGRAASALADALRDGLRPEWGEVRVIPNPAAPGRFVVVGERDGFGVAGVVDAARRGECADGEVWVSVGAHPLGRAGGATAAGPVGPRRHERTRLPVVPVPE